MKAAAALDYLRDRAPDGAGQRSRCFLLKRAGQTSQLRKVEELTAGWFFEFDEQSGQTKLTIAVNDKDLGDLIAQSSYVALGVPKSDGSFDVYSIDPTRPDVLAPDLTSPAWRLFVIKEPTERYA